METADFVSIHYVRQELLRMSNAKIAMPFQIAFSTANREKQTGGKLIYLQKALLSKNQHGKKALKNEPLVKTDSRTDPKHQKNNTYNVVCQQTGDFYKLHYHLIIEFQNKEVRPNKY